jgi:hypothetical protein
MELSHKESYLVTIVNDTAIFLALAMKLKDEHWLIVFFVSLHGI